MKRKPIVVLKSNIVTMREMENGIYQFFIDHTNPCGEGYRAYIPFKNKDELIKRIMSRVFLTYKVKDEKFLNEKMVKQFDEYLLLKKRKKDADVRELRLNKINPIKRWMIIFFRKTLKRLYLKWL